MPWIGEVVDPFLDGFFARHMGLSAQTMGLFALSLGIESFVLPRVMSGVVDAIRKSGPDAEAEVRRRMALLAVMYALTQYSFAAYEDSRNEMQPLLHAYIMNELVERVMRRYTTTFEGVNPALVYSKIELVHTYLRSAMFKIFTSGIPEVVTMVGLGISFAQIHTGLGLAVVTMLALHFAVVTDQSASRCQEETLAHAKFEEAVTNHLNDRLSNLDAIVTAAHGRGLDQELVAVRAMSEYRTLLHRMETTCSARQRTQSYASSALIMLVVITCTYFLYAERPRRVGDEDLGTIMFTLNVLFNHTYYLSHTIPGLVSDLRNLNVHAEFLRSLLVDEGASGIVLTEEAETGFVGGTAGCVRFDRVDFDYGSDARLFRSLDVLLPRGVLIGLMGPSGSGKTTFVRMVLGQLRPASGRVHLDGAEAHDWPAGTVAYIGQNTTRLFHQTVRYNIEYGHAPHQLRRVYAAGGGSLEAYLRGLGLEQVLPDLEASVGPLGESVSGGQRQTIHLLRCILNDRARIVILDEPTSALDAVATVAVCRLMWALARTRARTVIVVTHDPAVEAVCGAFLRFGKSAGGRTSNPVLSFLRAEGEEEKEKDKEAEAES